MFDRVPTPEPLPGVWKAIQTILYYEVSNYDPQRTEG